MKREGLLLFSFTLAVAGDAAAEPPNGASWVRSMGSGARTALAPSGPVGALVSVPGGSIDIPGVQRIHRDIGIISGTPESLIRFSDEHPGVRMEVAPPLRPLLDQAGRFIRSDVARTAHGVDGTGVLVGVADTGLDLSHPDLRDATGKTRVRWYLDLAVPPSGKHPDLEDKFGVKDSTGKVVSGLVLSSDEIDAALTSSASLPKDQVGHGTNVMSLAAGNGGVEKKYVGVAPNAGLLFARVSRDTSGSVTNEDLVRGVAFMFDRAESEKLPAVINMSLGTDFGPHDGTMLWERALASFVGPSHPGHALVVAAGNSGSIAESAVHQNVYVSDGDRVRVRVSTQGADTEGRVQVWVTTRVGSKLRIGLESPDGEWIEPVGEGGVGTYEGGSASAQVVFGGAPAGSDVPRDSHSAIVNWRGVWPAGSYSVVLEGQGVADLYFEALSGATSGGKRVSFEGGVRESTVSLPATEPSLLAVGCTVDRVEWTSQGGVIPKPHVAPLDPTGRKLQAGAERRALTSGEVCWFSGSGPTAIGMAKPDISAPGGFIVGAMSHEAQPGGAYSIFTSRGCPANPGQPVDERCFQVDDTHAVATGTSMSAPLVAGSVALLLQRDATLAQEQITALIQAGAHPFRAAVPYDGQAGVGELDVAGSLDALEQMKSKGGYLPDARSSWAALGASYVAADGSTPLQVFYELRTTDGLSRADLFSNDRLKCTARVGSVQLETPTVVRRAPGLYSCDIVVKPGFGGLAMTVGALFDGQPIVSEKTVPVSVDAWGSSYGPSAKGGCAFGHRRSGLGLSLAAAAIAVACAGSIVRRRRRSR